MDSNIALNTKIKQHLMLNYGCDIASATKRQIYESVIATVNHLLAEKRYSTNEEVNKQQAKRVYYMSMEFLVGQSLRNNLFNLGIEKQVRELLKKDGVELEKIYEMEPDAGLGNGGLGRLASCYMDALTSQNYPITGFSIRYEFGVFKQVISDGWQREYPDDWLNMGGYWLIPRLDEETEVHFYGTTTEHWDSTGLNIVHTGYSSVKAIPYDMLISGYESSTVNTLRLWSAVSSNGFDMPLFSKGEYAKSTEEEAIASSISKVLYPADNNEQGKILRIKQQYFFVSASLQQILKNHIQQYRTLDNLAEKVAIHINDTHPALAVPELMRLLMDDYDYQWDQAWKISTSVFAYTNHTIMSEALEKWSVSLFQPILPRIFTIIAEINHRFCNDLIAKNRGNQIEQAAIICQNMVRMANLSIIGSHSVNGVSRLHSDILKNDFFHLFDEIYPGKFTNVTNGIAHRRWLCQANPNLYHYLKELLGKDLTFDLDNIAELQNFKDDENVLQTLKDIKKQNKERLARLIRKTSDVAVDTDSIFDIQVKRMHEYKRQMLNALHILYLYRKIKNEKLKIIPQTFIFAAKASVGYQMAKETIRFIYAIADLIHRDPDVRDYIKVVFVPDYKVSLAEIIIPAADISEQISQAGKEASGTGNMKLMVNGAVTLGTMDGANVEIYDSVGEENIFIFGLRAHEVQDLYQKGYRSKSYYESNPDLKDVIDFIQRDGIGGKHFDQICYYLINNDPYMNLADFASYREAQQKVQKSFGDWKDFTKKSLLNIAGAGFFSADRSVKEYADHIWNLKPLEQSKIKQ